MYENRLLSNRKKNAVIKLVILDYNLIENSIGPLALGRKNNLFAGSHEAAQNAAMTYSLLATCKINNVEPFSWLRKTLSVLPDCPANQLNTLLPGQK